MVAELVGDDVGLGEVAGRAEALVELAEEAEVEVDLAVERAVERPRRLGRGPQADCVPPVNRTTVARV